MNKIIKKIQEKLSNSDDLLAALGKLPTSELNSFLLELFRQKASQVSPAELLSQFKNNRFVIPSDIDLIRIKETEIGWLKYASKNGFEPVNLSPLAPFGSCSAVAYVDQNNVVSALRGTEIVSDATNILALKIAREFQDENNKKLVLKYSTVHRHVRGQYFTNPDFSAHFSVFCMASGGFDTGNYEFEISQMNEHISILYYLLSKNFDEKDLFIRFYLKAGTEPFLALLKNTGNLFLADKDFEIREDRLNKYYSTVQFKIFLKKNEQEINLADGGIVDWTQKLLANKKHRLLISGIGLDLVEKFKNVGSE